jgi:hypothetical protein
MLATGTIDPVLRNFDIAGVLETNTSISVINNTLKLSYLSEEGKLIQLVKQISPTENISVGDAVSISTASDANGLGGFAARTNSGEGVARSLTIVDWNATSNLTTNTFVDSNGVTRTAVLLPVVMG